MSGATTFSAFHRFRVGAWVNIDYVGHPEFFLDRAGDIASAFLGHWLSPSAGLVWFWPLAVMVFAKTWPRSVLPIGVVVAYAAGLSLWWSPYGWIAWGDRLLYPMVCAAMFTCAAGADRNDGDGAAGLGPVMFVLAIALMSGAASSAVTADGAVLTRFFAADARFPGPPTIQADVDLYREFLRHLTWQRRLDLAAVFSPLATPLGAAIAGVVGVVSITLLRPRSTAKGDSRRDIY